MMQTIRRFFVRHIPEMIMALNEIATELKHANELKEMELKIKGENK